MVNVSSLLASKLIGLGFLDIVVFLFVLSVIYALLKKMKILGTSPIVNSVIAFSIAFMVFIYPVVSGINLTVPLSNFFTELMIFVLVFFAGFLLASFFYPDMGKVLASVMTKSTTLWIMVSLGVALFIISGLLTAFISHTSVSNSQPMNTPQPGQTGSINDIYVIIAGLIILVIILIIAGAVGK